MFIKLEKTILMYEERVKRLLKQGFNIVAMEGDSLLLYKPDKFI